LLGKEKLSSLGSCLLLFCREHFLARPPEYRHGPRAQVWLPPRARKAKGAALTLCDEAELNNRAVIMPGWSCLLKQ
jgi:hypothetical protein